MKNLGRILTKFVREEKTDMDFQVLVDKLKNDLRLPFRSWINEIQNLTYLIEKSSPRLAILDHWKNRVLELKKMYLSEFNRLYFSKKISELPDRDLLLFYRRFSKEKD
jgi:hypothetical protein